MAFEAGQKVGDYEIVGLLGAGGLGAVYRARHVISLRHEALKVALPERMEAVEMGERFQREIQVLAGLNHPNIAGLHHAFYHGAELVMVMELVEGEDLRARSRRAPIALPVLLGYAGQVLLALEYAHAAGVVHRDIKPANIMLTPQGRVKVLDFGIATNRVSADLTATGAMIGSLHYMSPEQIQGGRATPQSDLYSFGVTLFELIAGELPLQGTSSFALMNAHIQQTPRSLSEVRPEIPLSLSAVIAKALAKDTQLRYQSSRELLTALESNQAPVASFTSVMPGEALKGPTGAGSMPGRSSSTTEHLPEALEQARKHLAEFIGPIAKVVIRRLAPQCSDLEQLYTRAAQEITGERDRQRFLSLRNAPR